MTSRAVQKAPALPALPEWFEGQQIEQAAVKALRPAFARALRIIFGALDEIDEQIELNPTHDIIRSVSDTLPWAAFSDELLRSWTPIAERVFRLAGEDALEDRPRFVVTKATDEQVRALSVRWANEHALELAEVTTLGTERGMRQALVQGIEENRDILSIARDIRTMVGITERNVATLGRRRAALEAEGVSPSRIQRSLQVQSNRMRRRRAESIARTEINRARNRGTWQTWDRLQGEGTFPPSTRKIWVANGACIICNNIVALGPVPIREPFQSSLGPVMMPPSHPNCRCSGALVFAPPGTA